MGLYMTSEMFWSTVPSLTVGTLIKANSFSMTHRARVFKVFIMLEMLLLVLVLAILKAIVLVSLIGVATLLNH